MKVEPKNKENRPKFITRFKEWWASLADTIAIGEFLSSFISPVAAKAAVATAVVGLAGGTVLYAKNVADKKAALEDAQTSRNSPPPIASAAPAIQQQIKASGKVSTPEEEIAKTELGQRTLNFVKDFNAFIDLRETNKPKTDAESYDKETIQLYNSQYKPSVTKLKVDFAKLKITGGSAFYYSDQFTLSTDAMRNISNGLVEMASKIE